MLVGVGGGGVGCGFFFFNDTATTEIYTLSLHDALPIYQDHLVNMGQLITLDGHPAQVIGVSEQGTLKVVLQTPESKLIRELRPGEIQLGYGR